MNTTTLIITPETLIENTVIAGNVDQKILSKCIRTAEDKYLMPIVGSSLFDTIIDMITGNTLSGDYATLVNRYMSPALQEYAFYEAIPFLTYKVRNKSISKQTSPDSQPIELDDLKYLRTTVKESAQFYGERLINYLQANMSSFPEYYLYNNTDDVTPAKSDRFLGIHFPGMNRGYDGFGKGFTTDINF